MVAAGDVFGGAEQQLITLCAAGQDRFEGTVFQTLRGPLEVAAIKAGVCVSVLDPGQGGLRGGARMLGEALEDGRYDVVHSHGYRASALIALASAARRIAPVVRTVHGAPEPWKAPRLALAAAADLLADTFLRATRVYVSHDLARRSSYPWRKCVIHNGVGPSGRSLERPDEFAAKVAHVVFVGRLEPVKAVSTLLAAMAQPGVRGSFVLHLVGDGSERAALEKQTITLGLTEFVRFHGFRSDALEFIAHADALVICSLHEGIPYVLLEALSVGTPAVCTRVGGIPELLRDGVDGLLVDPGSVSGLGAAIRRIVSDKDLAERLSVSGRRRIEAEFSAEAMASSYAVLYQEVAGAQSLR